MTPTSHEFDIDVTVVDDDFADCAGFGVSTCSRVPARTIEISPIVLSELVLSCRNEGVHD